MVRKTNDNKKKNYFKKLGVKPEVKEKNFIFNEIRGIRIRFKVKKKKKRNSIMHKYVLSIHIYIYIYLCAHCVNILFFWNIISINKNFQKFDLKILLNLPLA